MKHITVILSLLRKLSCEITPMTPCYNGNISSRVFAGRRYDYTYDGYDSNSNISSLSRSGIVNIAGSTPVYNTHDYLYYTYDGNQLVSLGAGSAGVNYEGRTGLGNSADGTLTYDSNGNLTSDGTRGIASVSYTLLNQPERIDFDSREALVNSYDGRGFKHMSRLLDSSGKTVTVRRYIGDAIIEDGAVTMQRFAGGYFDANGVANYYLTDYQGNVTEVVNASGAVVQSVRYYPDGEPWMEPTGTNRYTFGGKERVNLGGLNQYDFGPRLLNAAAGVWGAPDRKAEKFYSISPYSYCAGNPVMLSDPSGCSPLFSLTGEFLGVDENGFTGQPYIVNKDEIEQGLPVEKIQEIAVPMEDLPLEIQDKINGQLAEFPSRPDYDGYLTYNESVDWYRHGKGKPLFVDISKIDFSSVEWPKKWNDKNQARVNLLDYWNHKTDHGRVYGNITLQKLQDGSVTSISDTYDFDMHNGLSPMTVLRNIATIYGAYKAGVGKKYNIYFYGSTTREQFKKIR